MINLEIHIKIWDKLKSITDKTSSEYYWFNTFNASGYKKSYIFKNMLTCNYAMLSFINNKEKE